MTDDTVVSINLHDRVEAKVFLERLLDLINTSESFQFVTYAFIDGNAEFITHVDSLSEAAGMTTRLSHQIMLHWDERA